MCLIPSWHLLFRGPRLAPLVPRVVQENRWSDRDLEWLTCCPAEEEDAVLVGEWDVAQDGVSVAKGFTGGGL